MCLSTLYLFPLNQCCQYFHFSHFESTDLAMDNICNLYTHREAAAWAPKIRHLPVTLVTGFLGAGKTTLLNYVLSNKHNLKVAAAVNDFASLNVDGQIVRGNKEHDSVVELTNGCLCCSISSEFQTAVWSLLQDADIGKIDYLLIETSGVTDPLATIATLEQDYGKMYRIRLDCVVTVVDTDALVSRIEANEPSILQSATADSQLQCADIVLLNKRDCISSSQLDVAVGFIRKQVPGARIHACVKCVVPLNYIMEVDEVAKVETVVSHEVTSAAYSIGIGGIKNQVRQKRLKETTKGKDIRNHIVEDEFSSLVFESSKPFILGLFQAFLASEFPHGVTRMKGTLWFDENRSCLYSFHMSGRQRYEISPSTSVRESLSGTFSVQLVIIGRSIDTLAIQTQLESCQVAAPSPNPPSCIESAIALVSSDLRFELIKSDVSGCEYVDFRVTGVIEFGVTVEEASTIHGINFNRMNSELVRQVNGSSGPVSLLPVLLPSGMQMCRYGLNKDADFSRAWTIISGIAKRLVDQFYRAVGYCKCGM